MKYGLEIVNFGELADPRSVVRLAVAAEAAGWDGLFVWDHLAFVWGVPSGDPWVILAAAAQATERLRLGTGVTPLPRRRVQVLANQLATLDLLSNGRLTLSAGLGGMPVEFAAFGEDDDARQRAARLDESLHVLTRWFAGETVTFAGEHLTVQDVKLAPLPVQEPLPIWIGGLSRPAFRRAARYHGWIIGTVDQDSNVTLPPETFAQHVAAINAHRRSDTPFDFVVDGVTEPGDTGLAPAYAAAGATWWLEIIHGFRYETFAEKLARVEAGPPVVSHAS